MNLEFIKPQNLGSLLMKSSQSNFNLRLPDSYLVRSYLITTVLPSHFIKSDLQQSFSLEIKVMFLLMCKCAFGSNHELQGDRHKT